jgi:hypothetical protein
MNLAFRTIGFRLVLSIFTQNISKENRENYVFVEEMDSISQNKNGP